jgi:hypothetical protein
LFYDLETRTWLIIKEITLNINNIKLLTMFLALKEITPCARHGCHGFLQKTPACLQCRGVVVGVVAAYGKLAL